VSNVTVTVNGTGERLADQYCNSQFADGRSEQHEQRDGAGHHDGDPGGGCGLGQTGPANVPASSTWYTRFRGRTLVLERRQRGGDDTLPLGGDVC